MPIRSVAVSPARALESLGESVRQIKGESPLTPITVVVPTNATGVTARRYLGAHGGVAAVDMLTLYRVAEVLGGPVLAAAKRQPVSTPVIDLAVQAVLRERPGAFEAVAEHPSTVVALRDLHREIRQAGPDAPRKLAESSKRGREAANISTQVTDRLRDWYDEGDLIVAAANVAITQPLPAQLQRIVVFLPHALKGGELALVQALSQQAQIEVVVASTGDLAVDTHIATMCAALGAPVTHLAITVGGTTPPAQLVSATDADEEVRHAVRVVVNAARDGVAFQRMAILWPVDQPYARLVEHHLNAAGIEWNGRPGTTIAERVAPRFLLDLLDVDRRGLRRRDLFELLADLPLRGSDGRSAVHRWERVSRDAGVTKDADWAPRLTRYAAGQRQRDTQRGVETSHRADDAEELLAFLTDLRRDLGHRSAVRRWDEWSDWSIRQINKRLGLGFIRSLGPTEQMALDHTSRVLDRLKSLDTVSGPATRAEFRAVFAAEFDVAPGRQGRIGTGVTIGSVSGAVGLDVDLAVVLGAAEGLMPGSPSSGPLISDTDRERAGLELSTAISLRMHRQFRSVLAAAGRTVVTRPRGDLRATSSREPSRWLAPLGIAVDEPLPSHHAALLATEFPVHEAEHRLRRRLASASAGVLPVDSTDVTSDLVLSASLALRTARRTPVFTAYDGDLTSLDLVHFERPIAPTHIEAWVKCPHAYFMKHMLGIYAVEEPGDIMEISSADRGNAMHEALDRFHREVIAGTLPQPVGSWSSHHAHRLLAIFDEVADEYESTGRTGRDASWVVERDDMRVDLSNWICRDSEYIAHYGLTIVSSEASFGDDGLVTLPLPDGRAIAVKGKIDRVDRTAGGELLVVDHKTGKVDAYTGIADGAPTALSTLFQLPAYAAGAAHLMAATDTPVRAEYSFFNKGNYRRIGYLFTGDVWQQVSTELSHVVDGIEAGLFPSIPERPGFQLYVKCIYCQPDELGTVERHGEWMRKRDDQRGVRWFATPHDGDRDGNDGDGAAFGELSGADS
ncbi:MAG TPA: PD-(D/E)XK nuclease family protein [Ilumatobacter sp.]|nr:PD-(D/E)XK nuclease family protein [Ilumatobacter sp.]